MTRGASRLFHDANKVLPLVGREGVKPPWLTLALCVGGGYAAAATASHEVLHAFRDFCDGPDCSGLRPEVSASPGHGSSPAAGEPAGLQGSGRIRRGVGEGVHEVDDRTENGSGVMNEDQVDS